VKLVFQNFCFVFILFGFFQITWGQTGHFQVDSNTIGLWRFDEGSGTTINDESSNNLDLILSGGAWVDGVEGKAVDFNGINDFAYHEDNALLENMTNQYTIEAVVWVDAFGGTWDHIADKGGMYAASFYYGTPAMYAKGVGGDWWTPQDSLGPIGKWINFTAVYDGSKQEIYIDGRLWSSRTASGNISKVNNLRFRIAAGDAGGSEGHYLNGKIDEVRVSNIARTPQGAPGGAIFPSDSNTIALWRFNEGSGDSIFDASGNGNDGAITGASWVSSPNGNALSFDGIDDYVRVAHQAIQVQNLTQLTLECVVKVSTVPTTGRNFLSKWGPGSSSDDAYGLGFSGAPAYVAMGLNNGSHQFLGVDTNPSPNQWVTYSAVYENGAMRIYFDETLVASSTVSSGSIQTITEDILIGVVDGGGGMGNWLDGEIDEIRISNIARYPSETTPTPCVSWPKNEKGFWDFNQGTGSILSDQSGLGNHGVISNATWTVGIEGGGLAFNGQGTYVTIPDNSSLKGMNELTIEAWFKSSVNPVPGGRTGTIVSKASYSGLGGNAYYIRTDGDFGIRYSVCDGAWCDNFWNLSLPSVGVWHYAVLTWEAGKPLKAYLDGDQIGTGDYSLTGPVANLTHVVNIGATDDSVASPYFNGVIDEVRISTAIVCSSRVKFIWDSLSPGGGSPVAPVLINYTPDPTTDKTPTLVWNSVASATNYNILIDTNNSFSSPIINANSGGGTSFTPSSELPLGKIYWKVSSNLDYTLYSSADDFTIEDSTSFVAPPVIIAFTPDPTTDRTPTLSWNLVGGASNYNVLADNNSDFSSPEINTITGNVSAYTPTTNLPTGRIYWKVSSNLDYSIYSTVDNFLINTLPNAPIIIPYTPDPTLDRTPTLQWVTVSGAGNYKIEISVSVAFDTAISGITTSGGAFTPTTDLPLGAIYWRVSNSLGSYLNWSIVDSLVIVAPVNAPDMTAFGYTTTTNPHPLVSWTQVSGAEFYKIQSAPVGDFSSGLRELVVSDTTQYTWAVDSLGLGNNFFRISSDLDFNVFSSPETLEVVNFRPPSILAPEEMMEVTRGDSLVWTSSVDASADTNWYEVVISISNDFSDTLFAGRVESPKVSIGDLDGVMDSFPELTPLFWKVTAHNSWGVQSNSSLTASFVIQKTVALGFYASRTPLSNSLSAFPNPFNPTLRVNFFD